MNPLVIKIYTDGSAHPQLNIGGWAAILVVGNDTIQLKGEVHNTTHNRMELLAVIKAIEFAEKNYSNIHLLIYTDSQYVFRIPERMEKLTQNNFITKKGNQLQNADLVQILIHQINKHNPEFVKVKAHQHLHAEFLNTPENYNSEVDKIARQVVRDAVKIEVQ